MSFRTARDPLKPTSRSTLRHIGRGGNVKLDAILAPNLDELGGAEAPRVVRGGARSGATTKSSPSTKALESALILHNYNVAAAAAELGVHRSTIYDWLRDIRRFFARPRP